jgi:hypothetical protein
MDWYEPRWILTLAIKSGLLLMTFRDSMRYWPKPHQSRSLSIRQTNFSPRSAKTNEHLWGLA